MLSNSNSNKDSGHRSGLIDDFLHPLLDASREFRTGILSGEIGFGNGVGDDGDEGGGGGGEEEEERGLSEALASLELLDMSVQQVEDVMGLRGIV